MRLTGSSSSRLDRHRPACWMVGQRALRRSSQQPACGSRWVTLEAGFLSGRKIELDILFSGQSISPAVTAAWSAGDGDKASLPSLATPALRSSPSMAGLGRLSPTTAAAAAPNAPDRRQSRGSGRGIHPSCACWAETRRRQNRPAPRKAASALPAARRRDR